MRLIDADALDLALGQACDAKRQTPRGCLNRFDLKDALDAAPTVCCAECEYGPPPADAVFEAQCDCELDSPGMLSHLPLDERLQHWTYWALYLKRRIEKHYRPAIAELEHHIDGWRGKYMDMKARAEKAEAEVALRDRMLVAEYDSPTPKTAGYMRWFTDLRARAEKEIDHALD